MRKLLIQPQARLDLLEIWHYIAADSVENANRVEEKLEAAIRRLAEMPGKTRRRPPSRLPLLNRLLLRHRLSL